MSSRSLRCVDIRTTATLYAFHYCSTWKSIDDRQFITSMNSMKIGTDLNILNCINNIRIRINQATLLRLLNTNLSLKPVLVSFMLSKLDFCCQEGKFVFHIRRQPMDQKLSWRPNCQKLLHPFTLQKYTQINDENFSKYLFLNLHCSL